MRTLIFTLLFSAAFLFAEEKVYHVPIVLNTPDEDGNVILDDYSRAAISNEAAVIAYDSAENWATWAVYEVTNAVDKATSNVDAAIMAQEDALIVNYYLKTLGDSDNTIVNTNIAVNIVGIDVESAPGGMISHITAVFDGGSTATNRVVFKASLNDTAWDDVAVVAQYPTNVVVDGVTTEATYFKVQTTTESGFFRVSATPKAVNVGDSLIIQGNVEIDGYYGVNHTFLVDMGGGVTNTMVLKAGGLMAGVMPIGRLLQDDTVYPEAAGEKVDLVDGVDTVDLVDAPAVAESGRNARVSTLSTSSTVSTTDALKSFMAAKYEWEHAQ